MGWSSSNGSMWHWEAYNCGRVLMVSWTELTSHLVCCVRGEKDPGWLHILTWTSQGKSWMLQEVENNSINQTMEYLPRDLRLDISSTILVFLAFPDTEMHLGFMGPCSNLFSKEFLFFFHHSPLQNIPSLSSARLLLLSNLWSFSRMPQLHSKMKALNRNKMTFSTILPFQKC